MWIDVKLLAAVARELKSLGYPVKSRSDIFRNLLSQAAEGCQPFHSTEDALDYLNDIGLLDTVSSRSMPKIIKSLKPSERVEDLARVVEETERKMKGDPNASTQEIL